MFYVNPLLSFEGFNYLLSLLSKRIPRAFIEQTISSFYSLDLSKENIYQEGKKNPYKVMQRKGIIDIIHKLETRSSVLEVGCGKGIFAAQIAVETNRRVTGIDKDENLINRAREDYQSIESLFFESQDAFTYYPQERIETVISLHTCGTLTDRVMDLAAQNKADLIAVPCCYGLLERSLPSDFPRSFTLRKMRKIYREEVIKNAASLENVSDASSSGQEILLRDIYRLLVNFDRLLYLKEEGFQVALVPIGQPRFKDKEGKEYGQSSLRYAIVGKNSTQ